MFAHISVNSRAHEEAFASVVSHSERVRKTSRNECWSLAELASDESDFDWLQTWALSLSPIVVRAMLSGRGHRLINGTMRPCAAAAGTLILMLFSEFARRRAAEGKLWPLIYSGDLFDARTRDELFTANHYPRRPLLHGIKQAVSQLQLRNAFDEKTVADEQRQQYYLTVFLQFGFSKPAIRQNLRRWLQGHRPWISVEMLLGNVGRQPSKTFREAWSVVRRLALGHITDDSAREGLLANPWIIPGWLDEILKETADASTVADGLRGAATAEEVHAPGEFLSGPVWRWRTNRPPRVIYRLRSLHDTQLADDHYDVVIAERLSGRMLMNEHGFSLRRPTDSSTDLSADEIEIVCPPVPQVDAQLVNERGDVIRQDRLLLWDAFAPISVFENNGEQAEPVDAGALLRTNRPYWLIVRRGATVCPAADWSWSAPGGSFSFHYLAAGWSPELRVCQGSAVLWRAHTASSAHLNREEDLNRHILAEAEICGRMIRISIWHQSSVRVTYVWCAGQEACNFSSDADGRRTKCFLRWQELPDPCQIQIHVGLICRERELRPVRQSVATRYCGVVRTTACGREAVMKDDPIYVHELAQNRLEFVPPPTSDERLQEWSLFEERNFVARLTRRRRPDRFIDQVSGVGGRAYLQPDQLSRNVSVQIAGAVIDGGALDASRPPTFASAPAEERLEAAFSNGYTVPSENHRLVVWTMNDQLLSRKLAEGRSENGRCAIGWALSDKSVRAVSLWHGGSRVGATWTPVWHQGLSRTSADEAQRRAKIIRWMRLPLLERGAERAVQSMIERQGAVVLAAWMQGIDLATDEEDVDLREDDVLDQRWLAAVREAFQDWRPDASEVASLVTRLGAPHSSFVPEQAARAAQELVRVDPFLAVRVFEAFLRGSLSSPPDRREAVARARMFLLNPRHQGSPAQESTRLRILLDECTNLIAGSGKFADQQIIEGCKQAVLSWRKPRLGEWQAVIDSLCRHHPGRRLIALHLIGSLSTELEHVAT